jgi:hypothetical protein
MVAARSSFSQVFTRSNPASNLDGGGKSNQTMGVDLFIIKPEGLLISLKNIPEAVREDLHNSDGRWRVEDSDQEIESDDSMPIPPESMSPYSFFAQDNYSLAPALEFEPFGLLVPPGKDVQYVFNDRVGGTPFSFVATGVYSLNNRVKGGANTPFVLAEYYADLIQSPGDFQLLVKEKLPNSRLKEETLMWLSEQKSLEYGAFLFSYFASAAALKSPKGT